MKKNLLLQSSFFALLLTFLFGIGQLQAVSAHRLTVKSQEALTKLCKKNAKAAELNQKAVAVLVFPEITKAGLLLGAEGGDGVLFRGGNVAGFYNIAAASYGLQLGVQRFGYALFFMNEKALNYFYNSNGFELGSNPSIAIGDVGAASSLSTTTLHKDIYSVFFRPRGLMAGLSLQGTKITKFTPSR